MKESGSHEKEYTVNPHWKVLKEETLWRTHGSVHYNTQPLLKEDTSRFQPINKIEVRDPSNQSNQKGTKIEDKDSEDYNYPPQTDPETGDHIFSNYPFYFDHLNDKARTSFERGWSCDQNPRLQLITQTWLLLSICLPKNEAQS